VTELVNDACFVVERSRGRQNLLGRAQGEGRIRRRTVEFETKACAAGMWRRQSKQEHRQLLFANCSQGVNRASEGGRTASMIYPNKSARMYQIRENLKGLPYERETDPCGLLWT